MMVPERGERPRALRVAVTPDSPIVVTGLTATLADAAPEITVVDLADLSAIPRGTDILLFDPQRHAAAAIAHLRRTSPGVIAVGFSWSTRPDRVDDARRLGAVAYLSKELTGTEIATTLRALSSGHRGRFVVLPYDARPAASTRPQLAGLTGRELEVLEMITLGYSNDEIARRLYLSINSVKTYVRTGYRKIGATRRTQAVLWGIQHGLAPHSPD